MLFAITCIDHPNKIDTRLAARSAHLDYIKKTGVVKMAGPFLNDKGEMIGSLLILSVDTLEQAKAWAAADPYAIANLFARVEIHEWKKVIG